MDYKTAMKEATLGRARPLYVCYGTEADLMEEFIEQLTEKMILPEQREFAISRYDLSEVPIETVVEDAETPPFMADRKLIIAEQATFLTGKDKSKVEHRIEPFATYLEQPAEFTVLVLTVAAEKLDERKKLVKRLKAEDALVLFNPMGAGELRKWVIALAKQKGCSIEDEAVSRLLLLCGTGLRTLKSELEKLSLYADDDKVISAAMVDELVVRSTEQTVFMLIDEAAAMNADKVFHILSELLKQREEPIKIVALIARQFRMMLQAKQLDQQGYSSREIASRIAVHPYAVKIALQQCARFSADRLSALMNQLAELDYAMKSGRIDKALGLELFLLELVSPSAEAAVSGRR